MNKWQQIYLNELYSGKMPRSKVGKNELELLGKVGDKVTVHFSEFHSSVVNDPAHVTTFTVRENENDMPNGFIEPICLATNLSLWESRGYKIEY